MLTYGTTTAHVDRSNTSVCVAAGIKKPKAIRKWLSVVVAVVVVVVGAGRVHRRKTEIIERGDEGKWDIKNN